MQGELQAGRFSSSLRAVSGPHGFVAGQEVITCTALPCCALPCPALHQHALLCPAVCHLLCMIQWHAHHFEGRFCEGQQTALKAASSCQQSRKSSQLPVQGMCSVGDSLALLTIRANANKPASIGQKQPNTQVLWQQQQHKCISAMDHSITTD